ncbi:NEW3 domain-containing protein [Hymenobacter lapidarius]|uniref:NEW3 domain-containing protein n=1 Tax=Hymenobacter lapidarius TaxID=1908237 RepID=UPI001EFBB4E8|nr:NEW3 domain-containing protein [Hymenobacter lapidarius]
MQAWQPKRLFWNTGSFFVKPGENMDGYLKLDAGGYNPLLGQSYGEIAARSRSNHRSQGFGSAAQRGEALEYFQPLKGTQATKDLFEGVDQTWNRVPGGAAVGKLIEEVIRKYDASNPSASVAGLEKVHEAMGKVGINNKERFWIGEKLGATSALIQACAGVYAEAVANESTFVSGGEASVTYEMVNRSALPIKLKMVKVNKVAYRGDPMTISNDGPEEDASQAAELGQNKRASGKLTVNGRNNFLISQPYWLREQGTIGMYKTGLERVVNFPENFPVASASFFYSINGGPTQIFTVPVQYKHTDPVLGELYQPLAVVPPVAVNLPAARAYVFADAQPKTVPVTLKAGRAGVAGTLALTLPPGWTSTPTRQSFALATKDAEQTVEFRVQPGPGAAPGKAELRAVATSTVRPIAAAFSKSPTPTSPPKPCFPKPWPRS